MKNINIHFLSYLLAILLFSSITQIKGQNSVTTHISRDCYLVLNDPSTITTHSALLNGTIVEKHPKPATYFFGIMDSNNIPIHIPATQNGNNITALADNLQPNTTYFFWIERQVNKQTTNGDWKFFTTLPAPLSPSKNAKLLPSPPSIKVSYTRHRSSLFGIIDGFLSFENLTGTKKKIVDACNYRNNIVRTEAVKVASKNAGSLNLGQICDIFDYCYDNWRYVNDPQKREYYEYASRTIKNGLRGDCDDFAILTCSMLLAIGADARLTFAQGKKGGHAYTEVNLGKADINTCADYIKARYSDKWSGQIWTKKDSEGNRWLNMDWWAKHPGGEYFSAKSGTVFYILDNYCTDFYIK